MKSVIHNKKNLLYFNNNIVKELKAMAIKSLKKKSRICCHIDIKDKTHEMIIVLMKDSYVRPHIHPSNKSESYMVISGKMSVLIFDNHGKIKKIINLGNCSSGKNFYYRTSKGYWHMPLATSKYCVYHETYSGPFVKNKDVKYASWAPDESDLFKAQSYIKNLKKKITNG